MFRPKFPSSTRKWYNFRKKSKKSQCFSFRRVSSFPCELLLLNHYYEKTIRIFSSPLLIFDFFPHLFPFRADLKAKQDLKENITTTNLPHEVKSWILQCWNHTRILMRTRVECKLGYFWVFRSWTRIPRFGKCNFFFSPSPSQTRSAHKKISDFLSLFLISKKKWRTRQDGYMLQLNRKYHKISILGTENDWKTAILIAIQVFRLKPLKFSQQPLSTARLNSKETNTTHIYYNYCYMIINDNHVCI
jgi:hypothetical protein